MTNNNMYRIGDYVYFDASNSNPYQIRKIEELNKLSNGSVEVKVLCFCRRRDLPEQLVAVADKYETLLPIEGANEIYLNTKHKHQLNQRELFFTRQSETLPATLIRGKCSVTFLNETESLVDYLNNDDSFFYTFVYDPIMKTLLADKGEIRVGSKFQADIPPLIKKNEDPRLQESLETSIWTTNSNLSNEQIDKFLVVARSIGTFARALDCNSSIKQPSLHMTAAAASRDITLLHAMDTLHKTGYDLSNATSALVPSTGPALCRDELEEWTAGENNLFEQAMAKYKKNFRSIRSEFLPWKSVNNLVEYYYMWKTTDRYVQQKRAKALEAESKLKQVFIPNYDKQNQNSWNNNCHIEITNGKHCESCSSIKSSQWYSWGPPHTQCKLCHDCWGYWKKYGGLKIASKLADNEEKKIPEEELFNSRKPNRCNVCAKEFKVKSHLIKHYNVVHGCDLRPGSRRPIMKTRTSFFLCTNLLQKLSRRIYRDIAQPQQISRRPFSVINADIMKLSLQKELMSKSPYELQKLLQLKRKLSERIENTVIRIWNLKDRHKLLPHEKPIFKPDRKSYMKPSDNTYHEVGNTEFEKIPDYSLKRRLVQDINQVEIPVKKVFRNTAYEETVVSQNPIHNFNGKSRVAAIARKKVLSLTGGTEDIYFKATALCKNIRHRYNVTLLRRAARRPWREFLPKNTDDTVVILD